MKRFEDVIIKCLNLARISMHEKLVIIFRKIKIQKYFNIFFPVE